MPTSHPFNQPANQYRLPKIISEGIDRCQTFFLFLTWVFSHCSRIASPISDRWPAKPSKINTVARRIHSCNTALNNALDWLPSCLMAKKGETHKLQHPYRVGSSVKAPCKHTESTNRVCSAKTSNPPNRPSSLHSSLLYERKVQKGGKNTIVNRFRNTISCFSSWIGESTKEPQMYIHQAITRPLARSW